LGTRPCKHNKPILNDLKKSRFLECDGQLKTGRMPLLPLGAEEFGFATAPLVASGCIMMRLSLKHLPSRYCNARP
jgi:glutamate synthase domain-containing protein 2